MGWNVGMWECCCCCEGGALFFCASKHPGHLLQMSRVIRELEKKLAAFISCSAIGWWVGGCCQRRMYATLIDKFWINHTGVEAAVMEDPPSATDGAPVIAEDLTAAADEPDFSTNTGFAYFKLIFGIVYMAVGFFCLAVFFSSRHVFEIRARSVNLVTVLGVLLLCYEGLSVDLQMIVLFGTRKHFLTNNLIVFFLTFSISSLYVSRVIRLAFSFSPRLRQSLPTLMSEKLLVGLSLSIGVASLGIPLYYYFAITNDADYRENQRGVIWTCTLVLHSLLFCLLAVVWSIDDLFHIGREIMVIVVLGLIQSVFVKLYIEDHLGDNLSQIINPPHMQLLANSVLFGLSIIDPVRRLKFNPMAQSSAAIAGAIATNSAAELRRHRRPGVSSNTRGSSSRSESGMWNYDKIATNQPMSEAFKTFANRALCQESVWFLEEVSRFQNGDYTIASPIGGGQVEAFEAITKRFVADGAPDEVNLRYEDKKRILRMYNDGTFGSDDDDIRHVGVFERAFSEVRFMIESNVVHKFTESEEFRTVAAGASSVSPRRFFLL
ncbi:unnamed protein product [Pylaiella littoralis]